MFKDMRTGPHHIFRIEEEKIRILLILTVKTALNLSSENLRRKLNYIGIIFSKKQTKLVFGRNENTLKKLKILRKS